MSLTIEVDGLGYKNIILYTNSSVLQIFRRHGLADILTSEKHLRNKVGHGPSRLLAQRHRQ